VRMVWRMIRSRSRPPPRGPFRISGETRAATLSKNAQDARNSEPVANPSNKDTGGTHFNVSGVVLAKNAPHKADAMKFIEWMVSPAAQQLHADATYEYPMRAGVAVNKTIAGYGELKRDPMALSQIATNRKKASALVDKVGFDN